MGKAGRERVKKYYVHQDMIRRYLENYEEALSQWQALDLS